MRQSCLSKISGKSKKKELLCYGFSPVLRWSDFYGLSWTLNFACKTLYAVFFSGWIRLLLGSRMTKSICPVKNAYRANLYANAVSCANLPVNCNVCSMNAKFRGRLHWSPDVMLVMLARNFSIFLEIWIYWQNNPPNNR